MSRQGSSSFYFQYIDGNSRVHNGNTYTRPATEHNRSSETDQERLFKTLPFDQAHNRRQNLREPNPNTCDWIRHTTQYRDWVDSEKFCDHHGLFWIKGKPGTGKSILMKYLLTVSTNAIPEAEIVSFFFNARGHELERTILGLYRSLLWQLMTMFPNLKNVFTELDFIDPRPIEQHGWQIQSLKNLLSRVVSKLRTCQIVFYIDALDECPENQARDMVSFFQEIGDIALERGSHLYFCFSSRHYPNISARKYIPMSIENEIGHNLDLERYIDSMLTIDSSGPVSYIKRRILQKASGVFLWVALVIPMLNKAFDCGKIDALGQQLERLPSELSLLFKDMLIRDLEDQDAMLLCFQLLLFTRRQLSLEELYFAINAGLDHPLAWGNHVSDEDMYRYILSSSKGLVEKVHSRDRKCYVQFIHESVRDFLLRGDELQILRPHLEGNFVGRSQDVVKQTCLKQIRYLLQFVDGDDIFSESRCEHKLATQSEAEHYRDTMNKTHPFLEYAVRNVLFHSDLAQHFGVQQSDWVRQFPLRPWSILHDIYCTRFGRMRSKDTKGSEILYTPDINMLYVLAHQNLVNLLQQSPDRLNHMDIKGGWYGTPLVAAIARGCREAARDLGLQAFLDKGLGISHDKEEEEYFSNLDGINFRPYDSQFICLLRLGCTTAMEAMWLQGENIERSDSNGRTPLYYAISNRSIKGVRWLFSHGYLDPNVLVKDDMTALIYMCRYFEDRKGEIDIFRFFLENPRVQVDLPDKSGRTPFSHAVGNGALRIAQVLYNTGLVNLNSRCHQGQSPLHYAIEPFRYYIQTPMAWLLPLATVKPDLKDYQGRTPLSHAAHRGIHDCVAVLLTSKGVDVESKDKEGQTPLYWAIRAFETLNHIHSKLRIVTDLLRTNQVNVDSKARNGLTPLTLAKTLSSTNDILVNCIGLMERYKRGERMPMTLKIVLALEANPQGYT